MHMKKVSRPSIEGVHQSVYGASPTDKCHRNIGIPDITRSKASLPRNLFHNFPHKGSLLGEVTLSSGDARFEFAKVGFLIHHP
jgi:hypothetical protein